VTAIDQHQLGLSVYRDNWPHPIKVMNLVGARKDRLPEADLWWMSPPCQPYTIRGAHRDLDDRRAESFKAVVAAIGECRPSFLALENVPPFAESRAHDLIVGTLIDLGYEVKERMLCPTEFGIPAQRNRFYLVAGRGLKPFRDPQSESRTLADYLDDDASPALDVEEELKARFGHAFHVVNREDPDAVAACFTSAYGNSPVYAGSYLRDGDRLRRFSPRELLRFLGFAESFKLPADLPLRKGWSLVGNSLSVPAVRSMLSAIPGL